MTAHTPQIAIAGAGSIGAYLGTVLAHEGERVRFLGRPYFQEVVAEYGLTATDHEGRLMHLTPGQVLATDDPGIMADAAIILVTVKSGDTAAMAEEIAVHAPESAAIISLQNGIDNADTLRRRLPRHRVITGMVPYNVVNLGRGQFRRSTSGSIIIDEAGADLVPRLCAAGHRIETSDDMRGVLWGKLLMNLNNGLNALSGLPLKDQLAHRGWRRLLAQMQGEALSALKAAGITPKAASPVPPALMPWILRLPTPLFQAVTARALRIDEGARSSMWEDLDRRRATEIDSLQGEIVRLAEQMGLSVPVCRAVMQAVHRAEATGQGAPMLTPADVVPRR